MAEYISKEALLAAYDAAHKGEPGRARKLIAEATAADVAPVVHGRWEPYTYISCGFKKSDGFVATCCTRWNKIRERYCPNCGADMRGE